MEVRTPHRWMRTVAVAALLVAGLASGSAQAALAAGPDGLADSKPAHRPAVNGAILLAGNGDGPSDQQKKDKGKQPAAGGKPPPKPKPGMAAGAASGNTSAAPGPSGSNTGHTNSTNRWSTDTVRPPSDGGSSDGGGSATSLDPQPATGGAGPTNPRNAGVFQPVRVPADAGSQGTQPSNAPSLGSGSTAGSVGTTPYGADRPASTSVQELEADVARQKAELERLKQKTGGGAAK